MKSEPDGSPWPQRARAFGDAMAALGLRLRGPLESEEERESFAERREWEERHRAEHQDTRRERRRSFLRDVAVQFFGSIAAAYFIILLAVLVGFLDDPQVVATVITGGVGLLTFFFIWMAAVCVFWGTKVQTLDAKYGRDHSGDDREELQFVAYRFLVSLVGAAVLVVVGIVVVVLGMGWAVSFS
jgi:hypothetical protein